MPDTAAAEAATAPTTSASPGEAAATHGDARHLAKKLMTGLGADSDAD
ncbi:hypothetical protein [Streptomyces sp. NPDC050355]